MRSLRVSREDLDEAQKEGLIQHKDVEPLWAFLTARAAANVQPAKAVPAAFDLAHLAWYAGAGFVLLAMLFFLSLTGFSGTSLLLTSAVYMTGFVLIGRRLWSKDDLKVPGGVLITLAVSMTPLAVFGVEQLFGWFEGAQPPYATWLIEATTIAAGLLALRFVRFPFLMAPIVASLLALVLDVTHHYVNLDWQQGMLVTAGFGLVLIGTAVQIDRKAHEDFAFWGYFFGAITFWLAATTLAFDRSTETMLAVYAGVNALMMVVSVLLGRRIFLTLGTLGIGGYIVHLAWGIFADSLMFPFVLTFVGIAIIYLGVQYHRNRQAIEDRVINAVPSGLRNWLPTRRG